MEHMQPHQEIHTKKKPMLHTFFTIFKVLTIDWKTQLVKVGQITNKLL